MDNKRNKLNTPIILSVLVFMIVSLFTFIMGKSVIQHSVSTATECSDGYTLSNNTCVANKLFIQYNGNGGTWNNPSKNLYDVNIYGTVVLKGKTTVYTQQVKYGQRLPSTGFIDYNGGYINFKKDGYEVISGQEYFIKTDSKKTPLNQNVDYTATYLSNLGGCDLSKSNCVIQLKVNWELKTQSTTYKIVYNKNNSSAVGSTVSSVHTQGVSKELTPNGYKLAGHIFAGWNTKSDGTGTNYSDKQLVTNLATNNKTIVLYAKWTPCPAGQYAEAGASFCKSCTGNTYTSSSGQSTCYACESGYIPNSNHTSCINDKGQSQNTVSKKTYTVTYNKNNQKANGITLSSKHTQGVSKELTPNGYKLAGHIFAGWNTKADGTGDNYLNKQSVTNLTINDSVVLYAKWTACLAGQYAEAGASFCKECTGNTYTDAPGQSVCLACEKGYISNNTHTGCSISKLKIMFNGNGQTDFQTNDSDLKIDSNGDVIYNNKILVKQVNYGSKINSKDGLYNYDNSNWINFKKAGYHASKNKEWYVEDSTGNKTYFNQNDNTLTANQLAEAAGCDLTKQECTVTLKVNWVPNILYIQYNGNGGAWNNSNKDLYNVNKYGTVVLNKTSTVYTQQVKYGETLPSSGFIDYNGKYFNWKNPNYTVTQKNEYYIKTDAQKTPLNQNYPYSSIYLSNLAKCDLSKNNCTIQLKVNWIIVVTQKIFRQSIVDYANYIYQNKRQEIKYVEPDNVDFTKIINGYFTTKNQYGMDCNAFVSFVLYNAIYANKIEEVFDKNFNRVAGNNSDIWSSHSKYYYSSTYYLSAGQKVSNLYNRIKSKLEPGDLLAIVAYDNNSYNSAIESKKEKRTHIMIYVGDGYFVHSVAGGLQRSKSISYSNKVGAFFEDGTHGSITLLKPSNIVDYKSLSPDIYTIIRYPDGKGDMKYVTKSK